MRASSEKILHVSNIILQNILNKETFLWPSFGLTNKNKNASSNQKQKKKKVVIKRKKKEANSKFRAIDKRLRSLSQASISANYMNLFLSSQEIVDVLQWIFHE